MFLKNKNLRTVLLHNKPTLLLGTIRKSQRLVVSKSGLALICEP
jgi:hypothetical protein